MLVPNELQEFPNFVVWRGEPRPRAKPAKIPHCPLDGRRASMTRRTDWTNVDQAIAAAPGFDGLGFVFSSSDPFAGVDLDGCRDPISGTIAQWAQDFISDLDSYAEVSPSGCGVKLFLRGAVPGGGRRLGPVELYSERRYFAVTGQHLAGTPNVLKDRDAHLLRLLRRLDHAPTPPVLTTTAEPRLVPADVVSTGGGGERGTLVLRKALGAANGAKFKRLWSGDTSEYGGDWSRADLALVRLLAYWTDRDGALVDALFRRSGLMRPKWDERRGHLTYGQRTIRAALGRW